MAIYRCEFKIISRAAGHKAVAAAAYRASEKLVDRTYGVTHDFTRKSNVGATFILAPDNAPDWMQDRAQLWNAVEAAERRKDAQLSREVLLSLPHELTDAQREALIRQFVAERFVSRGMVADVAIHGHSPNGDERNYHAHVMLTTRTLTLGTFGPKERSWNGKEFLHETRVAWAEAQNRLFERLGLDLRVDHRSLADQGLDREPEPKLGPNATEALRNGEPEKAERVIGDYEAVKDRNADREDLKEQLEVIDLAIARLDKAQGDRAAEAVAELALRHAKDFEALQGAQRDAQLAGRRGAMAELRSAVHDARAAHDAYRAELKPSFIRRLGEIVTLKGREAKAERDAKLAIFKKDQDRQLNILRARLRAEGRTLRADHADERDRLRDAQAGERDALARQHGQDRMLEVDALIERMKARHAAAEARSAGQGGAAPSAAPQGARPVSDAAKPAPAAPQAPAAKDAPALDPVRQKAMDAEVDRIVGKVLDELGHVEKDGGDKGDGKSGSSSGGGATPRPAIPPEAEMPPPPAEPPPVESVPGFDAASLKRMDAEADKAIARLMEDLSEERKAKPAPLPTAKVDPIVAGSSDERKGTEQKKSASSSSGGAAPRTAVPSAAGKPAPTEELRPIEGVPGFDAASLKRIDAEADKAIARLVEDLSEERKVRPAPLPTAKVDPADVRDTGPPPVSGRSEPAAKLPAPVSRQPGDPRGEREPPPDLIPSEGLKPADEREQLTQEEREKLARREKAIRMRKARDARFARAREQDRNRDRDDGPDR